MSKLSLLIFSRNDIKEAVALIKDMYTHVNEIVLIDSSDKKNHAKLKQMEKRLSKLRVHYVIALGYPDPLRQYGYSKCSNEWVLLMDTDERLSQKLKAQLQSLISITVISGYYIKRYEDVQKETRSSFYTWQLRLYKKSEVISTGNIHETPYLKAGGVHLRDYGSNYGSYMKHRTELKHYGKEGNLSYAKMYIFDSKPLYWLVARDIYISFGFNKLNTILSMGKIISNSLATYRQGRTNEVKEITRILSKVGVTKFLELDKEETIKKLNAKYANSEQGIDLLIKLLKEEYHKG